MKQTQFFIICALLTLGTITFAQAEQLAGRVLSADGLPVAGARVLSPDTVPSTEAITGADGEFVLKDLTPGSVAVIAVHDKQGAISTRKISGGTDVTLKLVPLSPPFTLDRPRAEKILSELWDWSEGRNHPGRDHLWLMLAPYDFGRAVELAQKPDGTLPDVFVFRTIANLGRHDPARAAAWGVPRLESMEDEGLRFMAAATLAGALAESDPKQAHELFEDAYAAKADSPVSNLHEIMMETAIKLKRPEARTLIARVFAHARKADTENEEEDEEWQSDRSTEAWLIGSIAQLDFAEGERLLEEVDAAKRADALARLIGVLVRQENAESMAKARQLLETLAAEEGPQARKYFASSAVSVLLAVGKTDPAAALTLARRVTEKDYKPEALAAAATFQDEATMRVLLREAADAALLHSSPVGQLASIALLAAPKFPELARELTTQAQRLWGTQLDERDAYWRDGSASNYFKAVAQFDKTTARGLLEMEWARVYPPAAGSNTVYELSTMVGVMAELDFDRALQMARSIPDGEWGFVLARFSAERGLVHRLLRGPEKWNDPQGYSWNRKQ